MKRILLLALLPLLLSCSFFQTQDASRSGSQVTAAETKKLSFALLTGEIARLRSPTVANTVQVLAEKYPGYLSSYNLVYRSRSTSQTAAPDQPRVLIFGPDADFIFSFTGEGLTGSSAIETISFNSGTDQFEMHEIFFKGEGGQPSFDRSEADFENDKVMISKANPTQCLNCHGSAKPHPIFENGDLWPGLYGSGAENEFTVTGHDLEKENWPHFHDQVKPSKARYKNLPEPAGALGGPANQTQSNGRMTDAIYRLAMAQLSHDLEVNPAGAKLGPAFAKYLACVNEGSSPVAAKNLALIPAAFRPGFDPNSMDFKMKLEKIQDDIIEMQLRNLRALDQDFAGGLKIKPALDLENQERFPFYQQQHPSVKPDLIMAAVDDSSDHALLTAVVQSLLEPLGLDLSDYAYDRDRALTFESDAGDGLLGLMDTPFLHSQSPAKGTCADSKD